MEKVLQAVHELEGKTKETYYASAFKPNFANKLFSSEARGLKNEKLVTVLEKDTRKGMGIYEFTNIMSIVERQTKHKKVRLFFDIDCSSISILMIL